MIKITKLKRSTPGHTHPSLNSTTFQPTALAKDTVLSPSPTSSSDSTCKIHTIIYPKIHICFAPSLPKHLSSSYKHPFLPYQQITSQVKLVSLPLQMFSAPSPSPDPYSTNLTRALFSKGTLGHALLCHEHPITCNLMENRI